MSREKLPLKATIEPSDVSHYYFRPAVDKIPRLHPHSDNLYDDTIDWVDHMAERASQKEVEVSHELQQIFDEARSFVEDLTGYDLSRVKLVGYGGDWKGFTASSALLEQKIRSSLDTNVPPYDTMRERLRHKVLVSLFVHELMHAAAAGTRRLAGIHGEDGGGGIQVITGLTAMDMRAPGLTALVESDVPLQVSTGYFFEEAAAEETAAMYRRSIDSDVLMYGTEICRLINHPKLPGLPYKYLSTDIGFSEDMPSYIFTTASFAAAGMDEVGRYIGIDMFQLMIDSRDPQKLVESRRGIIRAVECVQRGLYTKLRDLPYTQDDFIRGYEMILAAIDEAKRRQLGALAVSA